MQNGEKEKLLQEAQTHVREMAERATALVPKAERRITSIKEDLKRVRHVNDITVAQNLLKFTEDTLAGLHNAPDSPYFARCDVHTASGEDKSLYFGKFFLPDLGIYSWAAPAARLRFEKPGTYEFEIEKDKKAGGTLQRVDQYLIAQGTITFMATATTDTPRTLVHHENFSIKKSLFALVEIVERMEKAQDEVIRADAHGSLLISGPAGSGKTTLALHRIAYLLQIPETAAVFTPQSILVLVQDNNTKQYFEGLLPSLGIPNVHIITFAAWALGILKLPHLTFTARVGENESERDMLEFQKNTTLKSLNAKTITATQPFAILEEAYAPHFTRNQHDLLKKQHQKKLVDRFDLMILLHHLKTQNKNGELTEVKRVYETTKSGKLTSKLKTVPLTYSLILVDEVQNYLPEQIQLLKSVSSPQTRAITYVGDLAQQTQLFTLKQWDDVHEHFAEGRIIALDKVYRSTKQILAYVKDYGFPVTVPEGLREGPPVREYRASREHSEHIAEHIEKIIAENTDILIGIIALTDEEVAPFLPLASEKVRVLSIREAQGIEFDVVIFLHPSSYIARAETHEYPLHLHEEKAKIIRDQIYVALTRAMNQLHVFFENH